MNANERSTEGGLEDQEASLEIEDTTNHKDSIVMATMILKDTTEVCMQRSTSLKCITLLPRQSLLLIKETHRECY